MVAFTVQLTRLAGDKARGLATEWSLDLAFFHNLVWNVVQGNGYRQSASYHEPPGLFNETHFEPILLVAAPFYALFPRVETLFAVQAGLVALGAVGVYRLARSGGARPAFAAAGALVYLSWWPAWRMALADLRPLTFCIPFLLLTAAALRERRLNEVLLWGLLACLCREELPVMVAGLGATAFLWRGADAEDRSQWRGLGVRLAGAALAFLAVTTALRSNATFYIRPDQWLRELLSSEGQSQAEMWGREPGEMLSIRLRFLGEWLLPAGAAALLAPELLLGVVPLFVYLFSQAHEWAGWEGPYIHHSAPAVAFIAAAAALGLPRALERIRDRRIRGVVAGVLLAVFFVGHRAMLADRFERVVLAEVEPWRNQDDHVREAWRLRNLVPEDAAVMTDYDTVHLFAGRDHVYCYQQEEIEPVWPPSEEPWVLLPPAPVQPDWALVKREHESWQERVRAAGLREVDGGDTWVLFRR